MLFTKYNINISPQKRKNADVLFVRIRITAKSNRVDLYLGITVKASQWDERRQEIKRGMRVDNVQYNIINGTLKTYRDFITQYFDGCALRDETPSLSELKDRFNQKFKLSNTAQSDEFFYLFDKFIEDKKGERGWSEEMKKTYERLRDIIKEFKPDIKFSDLSTSTMNDLMKHLSKTMFNDAISKRLSYLRGFVTWAKAKKYGVNEEFFSYNPKLTKAKKEVRYLTLEEIEILYTMTLTPDSALDRTRDMFLFQCYTALRFSDLKQLKHDNISKDQKGKYFIDLVTEKDDGRINFPLPKRAIEIFEKYKDKRYPDDLVFPLISNQKYNEHLKELGKLAELKGFWTDYEYRLSEKITVKIPKSDLSTHTARRTFIVTAINESIDPTLIALITSHSDLKSMRPYLAKNEKGTQLVIDAIDNAGKNLGSKEEK